MILGIDLGTSAIKIIAVRERSTVASASVPLSLQSPEFGWSEQAPEDWWTAFCIALQGLSADIKLSEINGIGLSGQMHGLVLLDQSHIPIRPAILWNDSRAAADCQTLSGRLPAIGEIAGVPPLPGLTAPKMMWLKRSCPSDYARVAHILLPKDYIGLRLHGGLSTDVSDGAGTLWLDQKARTWSHAVCAASDTNPDWLPNLADGHHQVGALSSTAARETGLPVGIPVFAGGGDAATGAVSLGATEAGCAFLSLGTSGQLFLAGNTYQPNPERFVHAFAHVLPDRWYQMAAMLNGSRPIAWLSQLLGVTSAEIVRLAESADLSRVPVFLPYLTGERSPHGDPNIRAAFSYLDDSTDRAGLCRAVLESIAFSFADATESFGDGLSGVSQVAAIGGGARSDLLLSLIAASTGLSVTRSSGSDHGPAFGAALLAGFGLGHLSRGDLSHQPAHTAIFEPQLDHQLSERLGKFRSLYSALKPIH